MATFSKLVSSFSLKIFVKVTLVNIVITCFTHYFTNLSVIIYRTHIWINFVKSIQPACMCASVHLLTFSKDFAKVRNALQYISFGKVCQRNRKHASNCFSQSIKKQRCKYIFFSKTFPQMHVTQVYISPYVCKFKPSFSPLVNFFKIPLVNLHMYNCLKAQVKKIVLKCTVITL